MSTFDPIAELLARLDSPASPRDEFAGALRERLVAELRPAVPLPRRRRTLRLALIAATLALFIAAVATATYFVTRSASEAPIGPVKNGPLTVARGDGIAELRFDGSWHVVWHCQPLPSCGIPTGFAWSPDGHRLAVAIPVFGRVRAEAGWRMVDTRTGSTLHITADVLGCHEQRDLAWSPTASESLTRAQASSSSSDRMDRNGYG